MEGNYVDHEVLDYLLETIKNRVIVDISEEKLKDWKYLLFVSDIKNIAKEKYDIDMKIQDLDSSIVDLLLKEFEKNIK